MMHIDHSVGTGLAATTSDRSSLLTLGPALHLQLIGPFRATSEDGTDLLPRTRKAAAILAFLACNEGPPIRRRDLETLLWSTRSPEQRGNSLRTALSELQEALRRSGRDPPLATLRDTLSLPAGTVHSDIQRLAEGAEPCPDILDRFCDDPLSDLGNLDAAFDKWLQKQRADLRRKAGKQARRLFETASDAATRLNAARRWTMVEPLSESAWLALIKSTTDRGDALSAIQACQAAFAKEFGQLPPLSILTMAASFRDYGGAGAASTLRRADAGNRAALLGVMPFRLLGNDVAAHLATGLADELTAALTKFRSLCVVDSGSLMYAAERLGEEAAIREHQLDFVLVGTAQQRENRLRIAVRLRRCSGPVEVLWADRIEVPADDLFDAQDQMAAQVVARIDPEIMFTASRSLDGRDSRPTSARELLLRAIPAIHRMNGHDLLEARALLDQAMVVDPHCGPAFAWAAYLRLFLIGQGWLGDTAALVEAEDLASRAVELDPLDAHALTILGHVRAFLHKRASDGLVLHERALSLNPNLAMAWVFSGMSLSYMGEHEAALSRFDRYDVLAPCHPQAFFFDAGRAIPLLSLRRYTEAAAVGRRALALQPKFSYPYKTFLSALGHLGLQAEAASVLDQLREIQPDFDLKMAEQRTPLLVAADREHYVRGLELAGLT